MYLDQRKAQQEKEQKENFEELKKWLASKQGKNFSPALQYIEHLEEMHELDKKELKEYKEFFSRLGKLTPRRSSTSDKIG